MDVSELRMRLESEGCSEHVYAILSSGNDVYCLNRRGENWVVYYTERGIDSDPIYTSNSEGVACQLFFDFIMKLEHRHMVGFFDSEAEAGALEEKLRSFGVAPVRNDMPSYRASRDPRYRVFVFGEDILKYRQHFGKEPQQSPRRFWRRWLPWR